MTIINRLYTKTFVFLHYVALLHDVIFSINQPSYKYKKKGESHFTTPLSHCKILFSCIFTIRLNTSSRSIGTLMSFGA